MNRKEKRRRRRRYEARRIFAFALLILLELVAAAIPTGVAAAVLVPICRVVRGYRAMSVEWILIGAVFVAAYAAIHNTVCNKLEEGQNS